MQYLAELKPGTHRSDADGEHLRRQAAVSAGGALESERKNEKRPGRCAGSPRCCREGRGVRRRPNGDAIVVVMAWPELRNGDVDVDIRDPWLDFLHLEMEGARGFWWCSQDDEGRPESTTRSKILQRARWFSGGEKALSFSLPCRRREEGAGGADGCVEEEIRRIRRRCRGPG
jgi:hypothetical protein